MRPSPTLIAPRIATAFNHNPTTAALGFGFGQGARHVALASSSMDGDMGAGREKEVGKAWWSVHEGVKKDNIPKANDAGWKWNFRSTAPAITHSKMEPITSPSVNKTTNPTTTQAKEKIPAPTIAWCDHLSMI